MIPAVTWRARLDQCDATIEECLARLDDRELMEEIYVWAKAPLTAVAMRPDWAACCTVRTMLEEHVRRKERAPAAGGEEGA